MSKVPPNKKQKISSDWREHLLPTLMTIVTQSLKVNEHHYFLESSLVFRNLCSSCRVVATQVGKFLHNNLCIWVYSKGKNNFLDFGFPVKRNTKVENAIREMHTTLKDLSARFRKIEMNGASLLFEMKGTRNYIATTWHRLDIISLSFSIMYVTFQDIASEDSTCLNSENAILSLTHDIMIKVGRSRTGAILFLQKVCLCFGSKELDLAIDANNVHGNLEVVWKTRHEGGPSTFLLCINKWSSYLKSNDIEVDCVADSINSTKRYLENRNDGCIMSKHHINRRMLDEMNAKRTAKKTARQPALSQKELLVYKDKRVSLIFWNFLSAKTYKTYFGTMKTTDFKDSVLIAIVGLDSNSIALRHAKAMALASGTSGNELSKANLSVDEHGMRWRRPYGWKESEVTKEEDGEVDKVEKELEKTEELEKTKTIEGEEEEEEEETGEEEEEEETKIVKGGDKVEKEERGDEEEESSSEEEEEAIEEEEEPKTNVCEEEEEGKVQKRKEIEEEEEESSSEEEEEEDVSTCTLSTFE